MTAISLDEIRARLDALEKKIGISRAEPEAPIRGVADTDFKDLLRRLTALEAAADARRGSAPR